MLNEKEIIANIVQKVQNENNGKNDWFKVAHLLAKVYGIVKSPNGCRKAYQRYLQAKPELKEAKEFYKNEGTSGSIEFKNDGTTISERKIQMSEKDMKNPEFVLKAHGFDTEEFELVSARNNFWTGHSSEQGEVINYQSKITVRPKIDRNELTREDIMRLIADFKPVASDLKVKPILDTKSEKLALELDLFDVHLGGLSWGEETGEDNDYKLTVNRIMNIAYQTKELIELFPIDKLYLIFGGDFFHIDNEGMTTVKGTKVDFDSRPYKMLQNGYKLIMQIIETVAIVPTEVIWIEGNHSKNLEFAVFNALPYIYTHLKHIKFDVTPRARKAFIYGSNLVGIHHGEMNKANAHGWLQNEFREEWGKSSYAETHSGHIHHESVIEKNGIINRSNPTAKPLDKYEYQEGYLSNKATICYLWSKEKALKAIYYLR